MMRVLSLTYDHPLTGHSGVSVYCRDLLPALALRGIEVAALSMGPRGLGRPRLRTDRHGAIRLYEILNPPIDPAASLNRPLQDLSNRRIENLLRECLAEFRPDLLHIHTLYGYPGSIIGAARSLGIAVVVTLHDYWAICPRVLLVRADGHSCDGPNGGQNCVEFCAPLDPLVRTLYRFGMRLPEGPLRRSFLTLRKAYKSLSARPTSVWDSSRAHAASNRLLGEHRLRAPALLGALEETDALLAVSEFAKLVYVRHGVAPDRIRTLPLALNNSPSQKLPRRMRQVIARPVTFGFLGRVTPLKGAHVFAEAARGVSTHRARFVLFGPIDEDSRAYLQQLAGDQPLEFHGPYSRERLPDILDQLDVVIVPSIGQETVGLVALEAQAAGVPVIASRIGALPERIRDTENGLLFAPGDAADLRSKVLQILDRPELIAEMSAQAGNTEPFDRHIDRLAAIYHETLRERRHTA